MNFLAILIVCLISYWELLCAPKTINPDGDIIRGFLRDLNGLPDYFQKMIEFRSIDLQPVRDFTFYVDYRIYEVFGINTNIWQNIIWWALGCYILLELLKEEFPEQAKKSLLACVLMFAAWPLFGNVVSWGMARKHLMCFCFILMATLDQRRKNYIASNASYILSVLCHPIGVLWPMWAVMTDRKHFRKFLPSLCFMVFAIVINSLYYSKSEFILSNYNSKFDEFHFWGHKFMILGRYFFNIFLPVRLSLTYVSDSHVMWIGYICIALMFAVYLDLKRPGPFWLKWTCFIVFPLATVINTPGVAVDTYLLLPSVAILMLALKLFPKVPNRAVLAILPFAMLMTWKTSSLWKEEIPFYSNSFKNAPSCKSAFNLAGHYFLYESSLPPELIQYFSIHPCPELNPANGAKATYFYSYFFLYEKFLPVEQRLANLAALGTDFSYPRFAKIALLAESGREDLALSELHESGKLFLNISYGPDDWDGIMSKRILPLCRKAGASDCLYALRNIKDQKAGPNLM